jgi:hypothetical protein
MYVKHAGAMTAMLSMTCAKAVARFQALPRVQERSTRLGAIVAILGPLLGLWTRVFKGDGQPRRSSGALDGTRNVERGGYSAGWSTLRICPREKRRAHGATAG